MVKPIIKPLHNRLIHLTHFPHCEHYYGFLVPVDHIDSTFWWAALVNIPLSLESRIQELVHKRK